MKIITKFLGLLTILTISGFIFGTNKAEAATITLSGSCSINDAITNANNDNQSGSANCTSGSGTDTIIIPTGTTNFSANTHIVSNINFQGTSSESSIIDAQDTYEGLFCDGSLGSQYSISVADLTIQNTAVPANFAQNTISAVNCNVTINDVEVSGSAGDTTLSFITDNNADMAVTIDGLYIHDSVGPGVYLFEAEGSNSTLTLNVNRLTVSNMLSAYIGLSAGLGIASRSGIINATITNSTLQPSTSTGVGIYTFSRADDNEDANVTINLVNTTIAQNSFSSGPTGGIYASVGADANFNAFLTINSRNTIIAGNIGSSGINNCEGQLLGNGGTEAINFTSLGNNISDDSSCIFNGTGDQQNVNNILSTLGPLQDNGGFNPTMALLVGSPAINTGASIGGVITDQRGIVRPQGSAYDIGAYEFVGSGSGGNNSGNSNLAGGNIPSVPNTGFRLLMNNPAFILITSFVCSALILIIARKYKTKH